MIDGLRPPPYNGYDGVAPSAPPSGIAHQGSGGVDRPLLQQPLATFRPDSPGNSPHRPSIGERLLRRLPYDMARALVYTYHRLQVVAWPEVVDREVAHAAGGYLLATRESGDSPAFLRWRRGFRRYALCALPAQLTAITATSSPTGVIGRVSAGDSRQFDRLVDPQAIVAVSRTGLAFVVPWLLAMRGASVALVAEPSDRARALLGNFRRWSSAGSIELIGADAWALHRARRATNRGKPVVIFPESFSSAGRRVKAPFLRSTVEAPLGTAMLARLSGLPVQPVCVVSDGSGARIEFAPRLHPGDFGSPEAMTVAMFEQFAVWAAAHATEWVGWGELGAHLQERTP